MRRVLLAAVVVLATLPALAAGAQVNASVTDVTVEPANPAPGESVTFSTTIRNLESSGDPLRIQAVAIRATDGDGIDELTRVRNIGTLSAGAELSLPLTHTFESTGTRDLRVYVFAKNANDGSNVELRYPLSVSVEERHPQVDVWTNDSVAGVASNGTVTVANGLDTSVSNIEVTVAGDDVTMVEDRSVFASLEQGETAEADFRFRPQSAGTSELTATVSYSLPSGTERTVTRNRTIEPDTARSNVVLETTRSGGGSEQTLAVDIINQGNTPANDIVVTGTADNATISQTIVDSVPPSSTKRVRLNASLSGPSADVVVRADYESGSDQQSVETTRTLRATPGAIELTGTDVTRAEGVLQITGSTGNVGTTKVQSVRIRVRDGENVEPAPPNRDFWVGEIPGSDFSSFDLTARATGNVSEIPLAVSYLVDGERVTQRFTVPVDSGLAADRSQQSGGGGPGAGLLAVVGLVLVALLVVAGILVRRYRQSDDDVEI